MSAMWGVGGWGGVWGSNRQTEINRMPKYSTDNRDHFRACGLSDAGSLAGAQAGGEMWLLGRSSQKDDGLLLNQQSPLDYHPANTAV